MQLHPSFSKGKKRIALRVILLPLSTLDYPYIQYPLGGTGTYSPYGTKIPCGLFVWVNISISIISVHPCVPIESFPIQYPLWAHLYKGVSKCVTVEWTDDHANHLYCFNLGISYRTEAGTHTHTRRSDGCA